MTILTRDESHTFVAAGVGQVDLTLTGGAMASVSIVRNGFAESNKYYENGSVFGFYAGDKVTIAAESGSIDFEVSQFDNLIVVSTDAPSDADGRPDGTIYFHIQP